MHSFDIEFETEHVVLRLAHMVDMKVKIVELSRFSGDINLMVASVLCLRASLNVFLSAFIAPRVA